MSDEKRSWIRPKPRPTPPPAPPPTKPATDLCLFLPTRETYWFHGVTIITDSPTVLEFDYVGESDGLKKRAMFAKSALAGWSKW
jgi:hypothetical protein